MMGETIHIACASDERYFPGLLTTLTSVVISSNVDIFFTMHIIDGGLKEASWDFIDTTLKKLGRVKLKRYKPNLKDFAGLPKFFYDSKLAYARLLLPKLLSIDKVVYIDSDFLFLKDAFNLWQIPLNGKSALVALDSNVKKLKNDCPVYKKLKLDPEAPYFNSGLMVMDLERFRSRNISFDTLEYVKNYPKACKFWDQSALNVILYNDFNLLDQQWNFQGANSIEEVKKVYRELNNFQVNHHFITSFKPWIKYDQDLPSQIFYALLNSIDYELNNNYFRDSIANYYRKKKLSKMLPWFYKFRGYKNKLMGEKKEAESDFKIADFWDEQLPALKLQYESHELFKNTLEIWEEKIKARLSKN